jgi:hypothetical protein
MGVNKNNSNNSVVVRNLTVHYNGTAGYPAGADAPLQLGLYNQTTQEVQVLVSSTAPAGGSTDKTVVSGSAVVLSGPAAAVPPSVDPSASPAPSGGAQPLQPAQITLAPLGSATFLPGDQQSLVVKGLSAKLIPGGAVYLTFAFSNGAEPLTVPAPVAIPLSPASRAPGVENENVGE